MRPSCCSRSVKPTCLYIKHPLGEEDFQKTSNRSVLRDYQEHTRNQMDSLILHVKDNHSFDAESMETH